MVNERDISYGYHFSGTTLLLSRNVIQPKWYDKL